MSWDPGFKLRPRHAGRELFVGEWHCSGETRPWSKELARYHQVDLQREGVHLRSIGQERHVVDPTTATLSASADEYAIASPTAHPQRSTLLFLRGGLAEELMPSLPARVCVISARSARLHLRLLGAADPLEVQETALALVNQVLLDAGGRPRRMHGVPPAWRRLAEAAQHLIATHFAERWTLETIATECRSSPFHLHRVFRAVTGESLHQHLTRLRLRFALFEIERSAGRLTGLALAAGFSSHSHFTTAFRREFGCSPSSMLKRTRPGACRPESREPVAARLWCGTVPR